MRSQNKGADRDLVEELIGEEAENDYMHKPDGSHEILNDIVVDRGPNPSMPHNPQAKVKIMLMYSSQQCQLSRSLATTSTLPPSKPTASASPPQLGPQPIIWQPGAPSATPKTPSSS